MSRFRARYSAAHAAVALVALLALLLLPSSLPAAPTPIPTRPAPAATQTLPADLAPLVNRTLAANGATPVVPLGATFKTTGLRFDDGQGAGLHLRAVGSGGRFNPVPAALPVTQGNRVTYDRGDVTEWYERGPLGIEQGFTLNTPPPGPKADGTVVLVVDAGDGLTATQDGATVRLVGTDGTAWEYGDVSAVDARGNQLPARRAVVDGAIRITVEDSGAVYPVVVDPFIQTARLTGTGEVGPSPYFGWSLALSADGNTALIGALNDDNRIGAAYAFVRAGTTWSAQGGKLVATGEVGPGEFGSGVALSADGNTALIGAAEDNRLGAAFTFTRTGTIWTQQGSKLVVSNPAGCAPFSSCGFGRSVALSADGNTALVGASVDAVVVGTSSANGAAYVFTRTGTNWTQQGGKLLGNVGPCGATCAFGLSVALSADGATALIGAPGDTDGIAADGIGSAFVFVRTGTTWTQQGSKLTGSGPDPFFTDFGWSVALSADGSTALIGEFFDQAGTGAAYVFVRSSGIWTQQGSKLRSSDITFAYQFGTAVALSADGNTALIGAPYGDAAYLFARSGTTWSQQQKVTGTGVGSCDPASVVCQFGEAVGLSGDGTTALVGAPADHNSIGATYVFTNTRVLTAVTVSGTTSLKVGQLAQFQATGTFSDASTQPLSSGTWQSSDPTIATVDANGNITGQRGGTVTITYTQDGVVGQLTVTITAPTPIGISVPPAPQSRPSVATDGIGSPSPAPAPRSVPGAASASSTDRPDTEPRTTAAVREAKERSPISHHVLPRQWILALCIALLGGIAGVLPTASVAAATTYTVNLPGDAGTSSGPTSGDIRFAIALANGIPGSTITFDPAATGPTITLTHGTLILSANMTITGPGANLLTISGNHAATVFQVTSGASASVTISGVTIADGVAPVRGPCGTYACGGGIYNIGTLVVANSTFTGNTAPGDGGGIYNVGLLSITNSTFTGNTAPSGLGGAIFDDGTLSVTNSTFAGNSTVSGLGSGGGIFTYGGTVTVTNSTFVGNSAPGDGGGIASNLGTLFVTNCTFTGNSAIDAGSGGGLGGGIANASGTVATLTNTIVAGNTASYNTGGSTGDLSNLYAGDMVGNNNLIGDDSIRYLSGSNNLNVPAMLGILGNYGGPTQTIPLLSGSPAINAGAPVGSGPVGATVPATDQRGFPRVGPPDIGAYEVQNAALTCGGSTTPTIKVGQVLLCTALVQSSDPTIVAADGVGNITGVRAGQATMTAQSPSVPGTVTVTVVAPTPIGVSVPLAPASRPSGATNGSGSPSPAPAPRSAPSAAPAGSSTGPTPNPAPPQR